MGIALGALCLILGGKAAWDAGKKRGEKDANAKKEQLTDGAGRQNITIMMPDKETMAQAQALAKALQSAMGGEGKTS